MTEINLEEPFYVRQCQFIAHDENRNEWFRKAMEEAIEEGAKWLRFSFDNAFNPRLMLIEGWRKKPKDEGAPRFSYAVK